MHESFSQYELCQRTERNKGLYTADQRVRRNDARGTRQNPSGNRRGLECPEERDYYPHWAPSPWIDIAVFTNDAQEEPCVDPEDEDCSVRCRYYLENSFNMHSKSYCDVNPGQDVSAKLNSQAWGQRKWYNNQDACEANGFSWYNISLSDVVDGLSYPMCAKTQFARVNHLGNAVDTTVGDFSTGDDDTQVAANLNANRVMWTVPDIPTPRGTQYYANNDMDHAYASCVLRVRYNITTSDFPAWPSDAMDPDHPWYNAMVTSANNSNSNSDVNPQTPLEQDPYVYIGAGDADNEDMFVSLAVNTNQYARTFQDRSYTFQIKRRPTATTETNTDTDVPALPEDAVGALSAATSNKVFNVNVRGKRGNIVQTYPAVEYDFVPNSLALEQGDVIHFQWTGSDYNPRRGCNDGEGGPPDPNDFKTSANTHQNSRADRSNIVFMEAMASNVPMDMAGYTQDQADTSNFDSATRIALSADAILAHTPCASAACTDMATCPTEDLADAEACVALIRRLAYLNQQQDGLALALREGEDCLTEDELDAINSKSERENHPLNCAKLNAKPFPYFDAGAMVLRRPGRFAFFSSRNNNFSNRDQTGIICVKGDGETCETDADGVLQDTNPFLNTEENLRATLGSGADSAAARCFDEANSDAAANAQGASSCQGAAEDDDILDDATVAIENKDNDALGDGNADPCDIIFWDITSSKSNRVVRYLMLAIILLFVGIFVTWLTYFSYNRYQAYLDKTYKFRDGKDWKARKQTEMT